MKRLTVLYSMIIATAVLSDVSFAQEVCSRYRVGSVFMDRTTQANYVIEACDSSVVPVRMITLWSKVSRTPPQTPQEATDAHRNAMQSLLTSELKGYAAGGMMSAGGAWFVAVDSSGDAAIVYSDEAAQARVLSRHQLPAADSVLVVILEHRSLPEAPIILSSEVVPGPLMVDRTNRTTQWQATQVAMVRAALARTRFCLVKEHPGSAPPDDLLVLSCG